MVNRFINPYLDFGRTLYVDSLCTSADLFTHLLDHGTLACGTIKLGKKGGPPKHLLTREKSHSVVQTLTDGTLNFIKLPEYGKEIQLLTTAHSDKKIDAEKEICGTSILRWQAVHDYNKCLNAVDRSVRMVNCNAFRRRTLKWWKKVFFHMFMVGVLNAYLIHKTTSVQKLSHRIFSRDLAKLLVQFMPIPAQVRLSEGVGHSAMFRLTARHFPRTIEPKQGQKEKIHSVHVLFAPFLIHANFHTIIALLVMWVSISPHALKFFTLRTIT